jgi:hypothetical protein
MAMVASRARRAWKSARRIFRWFRIAALVLVLLLAGFLFYWSRAGLPDFIKDIILAQLRTNGVELKFEKIRFRWDKGIVAEKVTFGRAQMVSGPELVMDQVQIGINADALLRGRLAVNRLRLLNGRLDWHFAGTNQPAAPLMVEKINSDLHIYPGPVWELKSFTAAFHGTDFSLSGTLSNATRLADLWATNQAPAVETTDAMLRRFVHSMTNWQFAGNPVMEVKFKGDAAQPEAIALELKVRAGQAHSPYGDYQQFALAAHMAPSTNRLVPAAEVSAKIGDGKTPWGEVRQVEMRMRVENPFAPASMSNLMGNATCAHLSTRWGQVSGAAVQLILAGGKTNLTISGERFEMPWGRAGKARLVLELSAEADQSFPRRLEAQVDTDDLEVRQAGRAQHVTGKISVRQGEEFTSAGNLRADLVLNRAQTPWAEAGEVTWHSEVEAQTNWLAALQGTNLPIWERFAPLAARWTMQLQEGRMTNLALGRLEMVGVWQAPRLEMKKLAADLYGGHAEISGWLEPASRQVEITTRLDFDLLRLVPLLPENARQALAGVAWEKAPHLSAHATATLPPWNTPATNYLALLKPALAFEGAATAGPGAYGALKVDEVAAQVGYARQTLQATNLYVRSGRDQVWVDSLTLSPADDFAVKARLLARPEVAQPLLSTNLQPIFEWVQFASPPSLLVEAQGNLGRWESFQVAATVLATNVTVRGVAVDRVEAQATYASNVLTVVHPTAERPEGRGEADLVIADFNREVVLLTNAHGRMDPLAIGTIIGPHVLKIIQPYQFAQAPLARVEGVIPMRGNARSDLHIEVEGGPFSWWRFHLTNVAATVHWHEQTVTITNMVGAFYQGRLVGNLFLDFAPTNRTDLTLTASISDVQFSQFMRDISDHTNSMEGRFSGHLVVTQADLEDWGSWNGYGNVDLRDGLIWDIPAFGILSDVLNKVAPGLGSARANRGSGSFVITNSVIRSEDLQILAKSFNLHYAGTVDFDYRLNALVEAEVLREAWIVGPAVSTLFKPLTKLFEFKVSGTLSDPKMKPVYIPGILLKAIHPIQSFKDLFSPSKESNSKEHAEPPPVQPVPPVPPGP